MPIQFPLELPVYPGFRNLSFRMQNVVGVNASPFTGEQQVYEFQGEWWEADISLPPIADRAVAEEWICLLAKLRGQSGTFLLGDPTCRSPRGTAFGSPLIPRSAVGSTVRSKTLKLCGLQANEPDILLPGDCLEISHNFLSSPTDFSGPDWTGDSVGASAPVVTANALAAPDGSMTASQIVFPMTGSGERSRVIQPISLTRFVDVTFGVWLKSPSGGQSVRLLLFADSSSPATEPYDEDYGMDVIVDERWGFFPVSSPFNTSPAQVVVGISQEGAAPGATVYAWGASADDGVTGRRLHKILSPADSDADGFATLDIFPRLRETPDECAQVILQGPRGEFRLADNKREWTVDAAKIYGLSFKAVEAL